MYSMVSSTQGEFTHECRFEKWIRSLFKLHAQWMRKGKVDVFGLKPTHKTMWAGNIALSL